MGIAVSDGRVTETAGEIVFTVTRQGATHDRATVQYRTVDGTATAGADYTARSGKLTFYWDETVKTVSVPAINDLMDEEDEETFTL